MLEISALQSNDSLHFYINFIKLQNHFLSPNMLLASMAFLASTGFLAFLF